MLLIGSAVSHMDFIKIYFLSQVVINSSGDNAARNLLHTYLTELQKAQESQSGK